MIDYVQGAAELLPRVEPLWLRLREHHARCSPHFGAAMAAATFDARRAELADKAARGELFVCLARAAEADVGYVVASLVGGQGEVDSLFVSPTARGQGIGHALTKRALDWLDARRTESVYVNVVFGNDEALRLYAKFGILPRSLNLYRNNRPG